MAISAWLRVRSGEKSTAYLRLPGGEASDNRPAPGMSRVLHTLRPVLSLAVP